MSYGTSWGYKKRNKSGTDIIEDCCITGILNIVGKHVYPNTILIKTTSLHASIPGNIFYS